MGNTPQGQNNYTTYRNMNTQGIEYKAGDRCDRRSNIFPDGLQCDPNTGVYTEINRTKTPVVYNPYPFDKYETTEAPYISTLKANSSCRQDDDCKGINRKLSKPNNIVYNCPNATCTGNSCSCGSGCEYDTYSGKCCQGIDVIHGQRFCVERTKAPKTIAPTVAPTGAPLKIEDKNITELLAKVEELKKNPEKADELVNTIVATLLAVIAANPEAGKQLQNMTKR